MKWFTRILLILALGGLAWWGWQRLTITEEQRVRRSLATLQRAVENMNFLTLDGGIAADYRDDRGLDKPALLTAIRAARLPYKTFLIFLTETTVTVEPDQQTATVVFIAKVLATPRDGGAESELFTERFRLTFRRLDRAWQLVATEVPKLSFE